jgi:hypothetical protein
MLGYTENYNARTVYINPSTDVTGCLNKMLQIKIEFMKKLRED